MSLFDDFEQGPKDSSTPTNLEFFSSPPQSIFPRLYSSGSRGSETKGWGGLSCNQPYAPPQPYYVFPTNFRIVRNLNDLSNEIENFFKSKSQKDVFYVSSTMSVFEGMIAQTTSHCAFRFSIYSTEVPDSFIVEGHSFEGDALLFAMLYKELKSTLEGKVIESNAFSDLDLDADGDLDDFPDGFSFGFGPPLLSQLTQISQSINPYNEYEIDTLQSLCGLLKDCENTRPGKRGTCAPHRGIDLNVAQNVTLFNQLMESLLRSLEANALEASSSWSQDAWSGDAYTTWSCHYAISALYFMVLIASFHQSATIKGQGTGGGGEGGEEMEMEKPFDSKLRKLLEKTLGILGEKFLGDVPGRPLSSSVDNLNYHSQYLSKTIKNIMEIV